MADQPYTSYSSYLRSRYGERVYRVGVDGGFSCPNRKGPREAGGGCIYCEAGGSRAPYLGDAGDLRGQVYRAISFLKRRYRARSFILYFQAYTSTFAPPERLKRIYDEGLSLASFRELVVSTRPDCVDERVADLLASYRTDDFDVWVELGLQSAHDETLHRINRGHTVATFERAFSLLAERDINTAVHVIFGLPGEGRHEILQTITFLADLAPQAIKIHNLTICRETTLGRLFLQGEATAPCAERHQQLVMEALELLPPHMIIMRLTSDCPADRLLAPRGFPDKALFLSRLRDRMRREGRYQGRLYGPRHGGRSGRGVARHNGGASEERYA